MLDHICPARVDNSYSGHKLGLYLLSAVTIVKTLQCLFVLIDSYSVIKSADGIPLDTFTPAAAQTVTAAFAGMGVSRLLICLICALVLARYRSAVALLFTLLIVHDIVREVVLHGARVGTPVGVIVNIALIGLMLIGVSLAAPRHVPSTKASGHTA